jgi:hypothetical protein
VSELDDCKEGLIQDLVLLELNWYESLWLLVVKESVVGVDRN